MFSQVLPQIGRLTLNRKRAGRVLKRLQEEFELSQLRKRERLETLILTVISQNTTDRNSSRAFESLSKALEISPEVLSEVSLPRLEEALKVAGLYRTKARAIREVARIISEDLGSLNFISENSLERARRRLIGLPGVGPKTADVVLLFSAGRATLPVDTHVNRVAKRLELVGAKADYEGVRRSLQELFDPQDYYAVHVLMISLGRSFCKARRPRCTQCPVNQLCPSKSLFTNS
jgi:endonuclease-3